MAHGFGPLCVSLSGRNEIIGIAKVFDAVWVGDVEAASFPDQEARAAFAAELRGCNAKHKSWQAKSGVALTASSATFVGLPGGRCHTQSSPSNLFAFSRGPFVHGSRSGSGMVQANTLLLTTLHKAEKVTAFFCSHGTHRWLAALRTTAEIHASRRGLHAWRRFMKRIGQGQAGSQDTSHRPVSRWSFSHAHRNA